MKDVLKGRLHVEGMHCERCIISITEALENTKGVFVDGVVLGHVLFRYDIRQNMEVIVKAIEELGYTVSEPTP